MSEPAAAAIFHYDLGSPYAHLTAARVDRELPGPVEWRPVLLGDIFAATGRSSWARTPRRADGMAEVERRAAELGLPPIRWPDPWPNDGLRAMRAAVHADARGRGREFADAAFDVQFAEGRPLSERAAIAAAAERAGLDPAEVLSATDDPDVKAGLRRNTEAALAAGAFGVPTIVVAGRAIWGDDRLGDAAARMREVAAGPAPAPDAEAARAFARRWLPAWTGNDPERLAAFYADDAFYSDPAVPAGVSGRPALTAYFRRLLARFPTWTWTNRDVSPFAGGFVNHWHASIPVGAETLECDGLCTVHLRDGLICRNEVFFDRSPLLAALAGPGAP